MLLTLSLIISICKNSYIDVDDGCLEQNLGDKFTSLFTSKIQISILSPSSENCHQHSVINFLSGLHFKNNEHPKISAVIVSAERILLGWVYSKLLPLVFKSGRRHLPLIFTSRTGKQNDFLDYLSLPNQDEFYFEGQNLIFF